MKIAIEGNIAAGKTTLLRNLSTIIAIPAI
jgi:deoxyadenosine/deoxycytidine kinase